MLFRSLLLWRGIENLILEDVQYTRYSQLARLISALDPMVIVIRLRPGRLLSLSDRPISNGCQSRPTIRSVSLQSLGLKLPWTEICRIIGDLLFPRGAVRVPKDLCLFCTDLVWTKAGVCSHKLVDLRHAVDALLRQLRSHKLHDGDVDLRFFAMQCNLRLRTYRAS